MLKGAKREPKGAQGREKGGQERSKRGPGEPGERPKESRSEESKSQDFFTERNMQIQRNLENCSQIDVFYGAGEPRGP